MYHLNGVGQRKSGLTSNKGGPSLLSTFRNPSTSSEPEATIQASGRTKGSARDDVIVSSAPSVAASLRSARICHRATIPMAGRSNGADDSDDDFVDIDSFAAPAQITVEPGSLPSEDGDIIPTVWKSAKEHDEETQRLLRESNLARINPQHVRGAGFNIDSVRQAPGPGWDKGPGKRKVKATYKGKSVVRSRPDPRAKKTTPLDAGDEGQLGVSNNTSVAWAQKGFKDPLKHYALPALKGAEPRPFRDPMHSLPPKTAHSQGGNDFTNTSLLKSQQKGFQDPTEKYKLRMQEELTLEFEKSKPKGFLNPFTKNYNLSPREEKSQSQTYYIDDLKDEIASVNHDGGSKKRKASRVVAIDLSTPKTSYRESEELSSSPNDGEGSLGGSQSSTIESQFPTSSQVRHMDDISLELRETKLREQEKKRKKRLATADICVLCDTVLPLGALDAWKSDDGELRSIRMAEWTEICNKHKAEDLRKEWKEKEYPVIEWKGLKKRVEKHHQYLVDIVENKVKSPFREAFAKQQKEIRGNTSLLLRKDHQLQYPGYYGPRGSGILLHEITVRLASTVGDAGKRDGLIAQGGVAAFIQTVLVPELGVRLIMEDMNVREAKARIILDESRNIGEKLNMDEFTEDIYDEDDGPWFDINAKTPEVAKKRGLLDGWNDFHEDY